VEGESLKRGYLGLRRKATPKVERSGSAKERKPTVEGKRRSRGKKERPRQGVAFLGIKIKEGAQETERV